MTTSADPNLASRPPHRPGSAGVSALETVGLTVDYGGFRALDSVDLTVTEHQITALIGPNGAGKTTCFNAICGFVPAAGQVAVHGRTVKGGDPTAIWRAGVARTFQKLELFWTLTVRENLQLAAHRASRLPGRTVPDPDDVLVLTALGDVAGELTANLPLGTCRVVELARALSTGASILLLDEASSGLDRDETQAFESIVNSVRRELGLTVLLVEHDMEFVMSLADRIFVLDFGKLIAEGSPAAIRRSELVQQVYLGGSLDIDESAFSGSPA